MTRPILVPFVLCLLRGAAAVAAPHDEPAVEQLVRIVDPETGVDASLDRLVAELAKADAVFLGETHLDETTHRFEQEVYRRLVEARQGRVVLALEMFHRDVQGVLDDYLAGRIDEAEFLSGSRPWQNYRTGYRPLIELAKEKGLPVVASNAARSAQRKVAMGGEEAFRSLSDDERAGLSEEVFPPTDEYWLRVENATRGHRGMLPGGTDRAYSTQSLWDNTMGESVAKALKRHEGWLVLHVNGGFHSDWWRGTVRQLKLRAPKAKVVTVGISPTSQPQAVDVSRESASTDWQVYASSRARDRNEGAFAVSLGGELRYRLHVPKASVSGDPLPLLVWLPDDGTPARDELALWKQRLGDEAIIAVVEQRWREQQDDLSSAGRWFWPGEFLQDLPAAAGGIERIQAYLLRYYPVDPGRVVVAGEGVGATVAVVAHLYGGRREGSTLAFAPRKHRELRDLPLPMAEDRVGLPAERTLAVLAPEADRDWWKQETADYGEAGLSARTEEWSADPWRELDQIRSGTRSALGLTPDAPKQAASRAHVVLAADTPLARNWAKRLATGHAERTGDAVALIPAARIEGLGERIGGSTELPASAVAEPFASGRASLPRAGGPFGGTTLVVLADELSDSERAAWTALEAEDPIRAESRFHRLRTATVHGERGLRAVLEKLKSERRTNVLIVPAAFAASPERMRTIRAAARELENEMTIEYRPGLGSSLALAAGEKAAKGDG